MRLVRTALAAFVVVLGVTAAAAQTGGITVKVFDSEGQPLPGAVVTISHGLGYIKEFAQMTNAQGVSDFPVLRPGSGYTIKVSFPSFSDIVQSDLHVKIGENTNVPVTMIAQITETVKVTAERQVVDLESTETTTRFSDDFIKDLPVPGRFYQNVLTLAPGVQDADGDGNPNVHGARDRDFKAVVSGISNVDPLTGQWMSQINANSIEEMEVITAGAGVEFGRAQGGFARIIQKQGSNDHEGVVEFYYRTSKLDGTGSSDDSNLPDPSFDWYQPAVQFSGPIIKDKLWYRLSHDLRRIEEPVNVTSGIVVSTTRAGTHSDQITWQISPRNTLAFQFQSDPLNVDNLGVSSLVPPESSLRYKRSGQSYSLTWKAPYSPKVLVESVVGWQDLNTGRFPSTAGVGNNCGNGPFQDEAYCVDALSGEASGSWFRTEDDHRQRFTAQTSATIFGGQFWGMQHQFKLGITVENERYFRHLERRPRSTLFRISNPEADPNQGSGDETERSFKLLAVSVAIPGVDDVRATGTNVSMYAEDQIKPLQNLSITLAARLDREEINSDDGSLPFSPADDLARFVELVNEGEIEPRAEAMSFTGYENLRDFEAQLLQIACASVSPENLGNCLQRTSGAIATARLSNLQRIRHQDNVALTNTTISPGMAVSWDPWSSGKTAFKFTARRQYGTIFLTIPLVELEPAFTDFAFRLGNGRCASDPKRNCQSDTQCAGLATTECVIPVDVDGDIAPAVNVQAVDRNLKTPYQDEMTFAFERELWTETQIRVEVVDRRFRDQIQDININLAPGDYGRCVRQTGAPGSANPTPWIDTTEGPDGILDDCIGTTELIPLGEGTTVDPLGRNTFRLQRPDGIPDLYIQNPAWGDIYLVGNFNQIDYQGFVVELTRRQYRSWEMNASYTWSKAKGDGEDYFQDVGDDPSLRTNEKGYQSYDQRHVVKLNATTVTPWGIRLGTTVQWQSGLPYSLLLRKLSNDAVPPPLDGLGQATPRARETYPTGVRNDQRNASFWDFGVKATKEMTVGRGMNLQVSAEIFNLLNDGTYAVYNPGARIGRQVNGNNEATQRFGRRWQLGMKLAF